MVPIPFSTFNSLGYHVMHPYVQNSVIRPVVESCYPGLGVKMVDKENKEYIPDAINNKKFNSHDKSLFQYIFH